jgi:hypothetical protein
LPLPYLVIPYTTKAKKVTDTISEDDKTAKAKKGNSAKFGD